MERVEIVCLFAYALRVGVARFSRPALDCGSLRVAGDAFRLTACRGICAPGISRVTAESYPSCEK